MNINNKICINIYNIDKDIKNNINHPNKSITTNEIISTKKIQCYATKKIGNIIKTLSYWNSTMNIHSNKGKNKI